MLQTIYRFPKAATIPENRKAIVCLSSDTGRKDENREIDLDCKAE